MSGSAVNRLWGAPRAQPSPQAAQTGRRPINHAQVAQSIRNGLQGQDQDTLIRRRDTAGKEMQFLAGVMTDPKANAKKVEHYVSSLTGIGEITPEEAIGIIRTLPQSGDSQDVREWAKMMYAAVMAVGIHAHAAYPLEAFPRQAQTPQPQPQQGPTQPPPQPEPDEDQEEEEEPEEGEAA